jgi:1-acyl-sn-glycerol-3-phosphate acyltransferase
LLRSAFILTVMAVAALVGVPLQWLSLKLGLPLRRLVPLWFHRIVLALLGVKVTIRGVPAAQRPLLFVSNHASWLDIPVLSSITPLVFVAKSEIAGWPLFGLFAKLQRSVFVDRTRRTEVTDKANEIVNRLQAGDNIVLFAEGTSSDGNGVVPFKTPLFAAAKPSGGTPLGADLCAQTLALTYTKLHGIALCRRGRPAVAWYGDMELVSHAWRLLGLGPLDAHIRLGPPVPLDDFADRKALARYAEAQVRKDVAELLRGRASSGRVRPAP